MTEGGADLNRWMVEGAVLKSSLPAPSRLIIFVLLTHVTSGTLTVPAEYSPSLSALERETGLSRGALSGHLNQLEAGGWLKRYRPTTKKALAQRARTSYRVSVPAALLARSGAEPVQDVNQFSTWTGTEEDQVRTGPGAEPVQEPNGTRSGAEHNPMSPQRSSSSTKKNAASAPESSKPKTRKSREGAKAAPTPEDEQARELTNGFWERYGTATAQSWIAIQKVVLTALKNGCERNAVAWALDALGRERRPVTGNTLTIALGRGQSQATGTDGIAGYGARAAVNDIEDWTIRT